MNSTPLAERMRPKTLEDYIGQGHLVGDEALLGRVIRSGNIPSMILWGPPGVGKTTLASIISSSLERPFYTLSAINSGVKEVREVISKVRHGGMFGGNAILFIDEIHRFSKSQQDSLLGAVEKGDITLIGATTENPSFEVIPALLSRCQVYTLKPFSEDNLTHLLDRAMKQDEELADKNITLKETGALMKFSGGDARRLLNIFELVVNSASSKKVEVTDELVHKVVQENPVMYDKAGEMHYDIASAFIKSIRGSDPNAAVYYLARMVEGGEDAKFIARRLIILASEDIGNANPTALVMATTTFQAVERVGWPESRIILAQCVTYLASSPKSNAAYSAIGLAQQSVRQTGNLPVPLHIRNAPTNLMKDLGYGKNYEYSHSYDDNFSAQEYLPKKLSGTTFYEPGNNPRENNLRTYLKSLWKDKYGY
ncbi:MAG: replication-associated recombination protein A [Flavobacteriales bacterium]|nr:replication-associated recombination protein A [Flavobacteriales bacterium]MDG1780368.1 replication-associated recombination protein A [Flavobacteriales bacterium]MDG2246564.1 replication-associated recombination protein A [Flavobacteriales bacterium]